MPNAQPMLAMAATTSHGMPKKKPSCGAHTPAGRSALAGSLLPSGALRVILALNRSLTSVKSFGGNTGLGSYLTSFILCFGYEDRDFGTWFSGLCILAVPLTVAVLRQGPALHLGIQIPGLILYHFKWTPAINLRNPGVVKVLHLLGPRILTMFFLQLFFIIRDNLASGMGEGAVTALNFGWFIMQVPETLIGTAYAIVILPTLSQFIARGEKNRYKQTINQSVRILIALTIPVTALLAITLPPIIDLVFGFSLAGTQLVVAATRAYLLGLVGHVLLELSARSFYAQQDARTPLYVAAINAAVYFVLAVTLSRTLGVVGIALANSIAFTGEALLLLYLLNRQMPGLLRVGKTLLRVLLATISAALIATALLTLLPVSAVLAAFAGLIAGGLIVVPFILPEIKLLMELD